MWRASVLTIFPEMFPGPLGISLAGKALNAGLWALEAIDIRAHDRSIRLVRDVGEWQRRALAVRAVRGDDARVEVHYV